MPTAYLQTENEFTKMSIIRKSCSSFFHSGWQLNVLDYRFISLTIFNAKPPQKQKLSSIYSRIESEVPWKFEPDLLHETNM